mmetsp:Transcript_35120/g.52204  ORF Transcript_35120/g.52204 Transcript_35120/m.52204 type:complete len:83 (+) Transcript_35120:735-983(+)
MEPDFLHLFGWIEIGDILYPVHRRWSQGLTMSVSGGAKLTTLPTPSQKGLSYEFPNQKDVKYIVIHVESLISTTGADNQHSD